MASKIEDSYLVKKGSDSYATIASKFNGVRILKIDGYLAKGKPINIYTAQWVDNQTEDCIVTLEDSSTHAPIVIRENVDLDITFIVSEKYFTPTQQTPTIDVAAVHDSFVDYMTTGEVYLKSLYVNREVRCICLKEYKPTTTKLNRPTAASFNGGQNTIAFGQNYIIGTISLHTLTAPNTPAST